MRKKKKKSKHPGKAHRKNKQWPTPPLNCFSDVNRTQPTMTDVWNMSRCCFRTSLELFGWVSSAATHAFVQFFFLPRLSSRVVALAPRSHSAELRNPLAAATPGKVALGKRVQAGHFLFVSWEENNPRIPKTPARFSSVGSANWMTWAKAAGRSMYVTEHKDARQGAGAATSIY